MSDYNISNVKLGEGDDWTLILTSSMNLPLPLALNDSDEHGKHKECVVTSDVYMAHSGVNRGSAIFTIVIKGYSRPLVYVAPPVIVPLMFAQLSNTHAMTRIVNLWLDQSSR